MIQPHKIYQGFRAITIGAIFRSDIFVRDFTFLAQKILINLMCDMKGNIALIIFRQRTWFWDSLVCLLLTLKGPPPKLVFDTTILV